MKPATILNADVVVVGSGPGGSTVAAQLAAAGKDVIVLEKGRAHRWVGNHMAALTYVDRFGLSFTEQGLNLVRAITTGGCTVIYCGTAADPPAWLKDRYGIDLQPYASDTIRELDVKPLPDDMCGKAAMRLMDAADSLGHPWQKLPKFINAAKCEVTCGGTCMLGCPHGAKWTAREYLAQAVSSGAKLVTRADVLAVQSQDGVATGVIANTPSGLLEVRAETVVVAAGGLGTPPILQRSGIHEAGIGIFVDPVVLVTAVGREKGTYSEPPMTVGTYEYLEDGILLANLIDPWILGILMTGMSQPSRLGLMKDYARTMGIMVKIGDERAGIVTMDGRVSKPLSLRDRSRLNRGTALAREILVRAGADPRSVVVGPVRGTHPGATARIGQVVDNDLETRIHNLYVADASVLPEALDRPVVLTVIALAKRLSRHLLSRDGDWDGANLRNRGAQSQPMAS